MSDLISREALKESFRNNCIHNCYYCNLSKWDNKGACCNCGLIDNAPTVELFCSYLSDGEVRQPCVEAPCEHERPQGKWLIEGGNTLHYVCSECGCAGDVWDKFCKHCGAKMKGGAE